MLNEVVYYGFINNETFEDPKPAITQFIKKMPKLSDSAINGDNTFLNCPAFQGLYKNTFSVTSPYDVDISIDTNNVKTHNWGQEFFDRVIFVRDIENRIISYMPPQIIFFSENKYLEIEQLPPILSPNYLKDCIYITGKYNIGRHFRNLEIALAFKEDSSFSIKAGDDMYYVRFNTNKKVVLKRFFYNQELHVIANSFVSCRNFTKKAIPLCEYYRKFCDFGYRKKVLKLIKSNLL